MTTPVTKQDDEKQQQKVHKVLCVHDGPVPDHLMQKHGDFTFFITQCLNEDPSLFTEHKIEIEKRVLFTDEAELPEDPSEYTAVIFSGSKHDITEQKPFAVRAAAWLKKHVKPGESSSVPILGICFGHQLLSYALGGKVDFNPKAYEFGTHTVRKTSHASTDPLARTLPTDELLVSEVHAQSVLERPEGSKAIFNNDIDDHQMLCFAPLVYGTQFHPEYTVDYVEDLGENGLLRFQNDGDKQVFLDGLKPVRESMRIVPNFVRLAIAARRGRAGES